MRASLVLSFGFLSVLGLYACGGEASDDVTTASEPFDQTEDALHGARRACRADTTPVAIATEAPNMIVTTIAENGRYIYYAVENHFFYVEPADPPQRFYALRRVLKTGGAPQTLYSSTTESVYPYGRLQFDGSHIYFTLSGDDGHRIVRMPKAGGAISTLTTEWLVGVERDGHFLFGTPGDGTLARVGKAGGAVTRLYPEEAFVLPVPTSGATVPEGVVTDDDYVYGSGPFDAANEGEKGGAYVLRVRKTGAAQPQWIAIVPPSASLKFGHTAHLLEVNGGKVYWEDQERLVWAANANGSGSPNVVVDFEAYYPDPELNQNRTQVVHLHDGKAILRNGDGGLPESSRKFEISEVPLGGGPKRVLGVINGNETGEWYDHAVDSSCVYVGSYSAAGARVTRIKR